MSGAGPAGIPRRRLAALVLRRAAHGFLRHRGLDAAAALTFFATLSVLPASLVAVSAFSLVDDRRRAIRELGAVIATFAGDGAPEAVEAIATQLLSLDAPPLGLAVGLVLLVWSVSSYSTAFGRAVNAVYEAQEGRQIWRFRGTMLVLACGLVVLGGAAAVILLVTPSVADVIVGGRGVDPVAATIWNVAKWPVLVALLVAILGALHWWSPNVRLESRRLASAGSAISIVLGAVATLGLAAYALLIGGYGYVYGAFGLALVGLLWLYVVNLSLVLGAEIDAELVRLHLLAEGEDASERIPLRVRDTSRLRMLARQLDEDVRASRELRRDPPG
jgi:membrane protein